MAHRVCLTLELAMQLGGFIVLRYYIILTHGIILIVHARALCLIKFIINNLFVNPVNT